jgi:hypothetical protein
MVLQRPHLIDANALGQFRLFELAPEQLLMRRVFTQRGIASSSPFHVLLLKDAYLDGSRVFLGRPSDFSFGGPQEAGCSTEQIIFIGDRPERGAGLLLIDPRDAPI